ncbi:Fe-S protein assembly co-chaperone HscB [Ferribacterium limneticum]|uniref:Fe-S protein assembly co-chaperone HscB n=1 Tax=Ferribacterium limneticum TaxID=76259 RepID=UPI001CFB6434|nr:Fe-S protein assembly co-chaperone HscB [Ferribacterium limneticum]UCV30091.1 Fe-S protein assembly co-chaperone HscB [Ferribacterium limneticum]UCV34010.1 Fe-S protein assembly co-chaperone HscB [Ferribacterium limneticum]
MDLRADHFSLFGLNRGFRIDLSDLDSRYRDVQAQVHPDRFANASDAERRMSMQWATHANEAYQTLKKPLERAKYLLHLADHDIQAENNTAMPADFLMEQMEWREAVMEARNGGDHHELEHLHNRLRGDIKSRYEELAQLLDDENDYAVATDRVRRLMFLEKLLYEIDDALASLED